MTGPGTGKQAPVILPAQEDLFWMYSTRQQEAVAQGPGAAASAPLNQHAAATSLPVQENLMLVRPPRPLSQRRLLSLPGMVIAFALVTALLTGLALGAGLALGQRTGPAFSHTGSQTPASSVSPTAPALVPVWRGSGRTPVDAGEAEAVAATFVQRYQTLDSRSLEQTLAAAEFVLTANARARFLGRVPDVLPDPRATAAFAQQVEQEHLHQVAVITAEQIVAAQTQNGLFFADVLVSYELFQTVHGRVQSLQSRQMVVLLLAVPFGNDVMGGIGWLVSNWQTGTHLPVLPLQP